MSSKNNDKYNSDKDKYNITTSPTIDTKEFIDLDKVNSDLISLDELEERYLYFMNEKVNNNQSIYSPRPPRKNKGKASSTYLRNYTMSKELNNVFTTQPTSMVFNKTMIISPLKPILEESVNTFNSKNKRHFSLPNIKFENVNISKDNTNTIMNIDTNKDKKYANNQNTNVISKKINKLNISKKGYYDKKGHYNKTDRNNNLKKLLQSNDTLINKAGHYIFKSNYRLKKYLITLHSSNFNVNNLVDKYFCKRVSITQNTEEWTWYNLKYNFSFHIKYNIDTYGITSDYAVYIKHTRNKSININNLLLSSNIAHLDKEMKNLFIDILKNNEKFFWQLSSIKYNKNTKYITCALLAPLQYYRLYLQYLSNNMVDITYTKLLDKLYYYGNIDINDKNLQNNLKNTIL